MPIAREQNDGCEYGGDHRGSEDCRLATGEIRDRGGVREFAHQQGDGESDAGQKADGSDVLPTNLGREARAREPRGHPGAAKNTNGLAHNESDNHCDTHRRGDCINEADGSKVNTSCEKREEWHA